ncbi:hypothetical protein ACFLTH_10555 [Bacteroidota bacterium]
MKKYILILLITPSLIFAQNNSGSSIYSLKNQINLSTPSQQQPQNFSDKIEKKKPGLAIIYSLLLPGMGEMYADSYDSGMYFTIAEGVLWGTWAGFSIYGNQQRDNYRAFAASHGGVSLEGKDDVYFATIGEYIDIDQFNREMELYRDFGEVYNIETHYWKWDGTAERREYRNMWTSSENAFNNIRFIIGAMVLNRLISAINAVRLVVAYNKNLEESVSWNISMNIKNQNHQPALYLNFNTAF